MSAPRHPTTRHPGAQPGAHPAAQPPRAPLARGRGDQGSVVVEMAFVAPLLVLLVLGILEFGTAWRERANLTGALQAAGRIDAASGATRDADYLALQAFYDQMSQNHELSIDQVIIYRSATSDGGPPAACLTSPGGSAGDQCSSFTWTQVAQVGQDPTPGRPVLAADFATAGGTCASSAWDGDWCPLGRHDQQSDPPDFVGIYAHGSYRSQTGLLPTTVTFTDQVVYRLDPEVSSS